MIRPMLMCMVLVAGLGCQGAGSKSARAVLTHPHVDRALLAEFPTERPADAVAFGGHWYKVFPRKVCWHMARAACAQMGGHLACIETEAEQQFIAELAQRKYYYLGATDEAEEGVWKWVNGAPWQYTQWFGGQPNNYRTNEHYLATYTRGQWVDVADQGTGFWMPKGFICEWPGAVAGARR